MRLNWLQKGGIVPFWMFLWKAFLTQTLLDPEALELTKLKINCQFFKRYINATLGGDSWPCLWVKQASGLLWNWGSDKNLGIWGPILTTLPGYLFFSRLSKCCNWSWVHHTWVKRWHPDQDLLYLFHVFTFCALTLYLQLGLIISVSLLVLTPKILRFKTSSRQCLPVPSPTLCIPQQSV